MKSVLFLDIDLNPKQTEILNDFNIVESQGLSWGKDNIEDENIKNFLYLAKVTESTDFQLSRIVGKVDRSTTILIEFISSLINLAINGEKFQHNKPNLEPSAFIINLMPFHFTSSVADKIIQGINLSLIENSFLINIPLSILVRNIDWFKDSQSTMKFVKEEKLKAPLSIIDIRGFRLIMKAGQEDTLEIIPRIAYQQALKYKGNTFFYELIYQTNTYIGHFALNNSHVRTCYDLYEFVRRDKVLEELNRQFSEFINGVENIIIIGAGLDHRTIFHVAYRFLTLNSNIIRFEDLCTVDIDASKVYEIARQSKRFVILLDIVNSGKTAKTIIELLKNNNIASNKIKVFSIAKMINSPSKDIDGCEFKSVLKIRRKYFKPNKQDCTLCILKQPIRVVNNVEDFQYIDINQLTPLDFWEIIKERDALEKEKEDLQGRKFLYRIDTIKIIEKYKNWLKNIIKLKISSKWPNWKPDALCTVDEKSGRSFAELVWQSLDMPLDTIVAVSRYDLNITTPGNLPHGTNPFSNLGLDVLLVDDGMNSGNTMMSMIQFCRAAGRRVRGGIVLDSRLNEKEIKKLEKEIMSEKIICLYTWPVPPMQIK